MEQTFHGKLTTNSQMVNGYLRPTTILKGGVTSLSLFSTLFLLKALLDAASGQVLRKSSQVHGGWMHCHRKAKGCASAHDKCSLDPHCSPGRRGPASAGLDAFPGEILELKNKMKKN